MSYTAPPSGGAVCSIGCLLVQAEMIVKAVWVASKRSAPLLAEGTFAGATWFGKWWHLVCPAPTLWESQSKGTSPTKARPRNANVFQQLTGWGNASKGLVSRFTSSLITC